MRTVLIDTKQLKRFEDDPEMTIDLQVSVTFVVIGCLRHYHFSIALPNRTPTHQSCA